MQSSPDASDAGTLPAEAAAETPEAPSPGFGMELRGRFRYRLIKRLGRGAFGAVFFARCVDSDARRDDSPPERVAIKILSKARGATVQMLRRELAAMLAVDCDRIPRVYDWSLDGDRAFVVMQYFGHGCLREQMPPATDVQPPEEAIWQLLSDLLRALDAAHHASVLHLDIKPANVLLDGRGGYVLTDFGVSQASRIDGVLPFSVGTRGYQAPEQRNERFDQYDLRTDLFGVGATAWSFAAGLNLAERMDLLRAEDGDSIYGLPPLSERRLDCSPQLEDVVMSLLHLDPSLRPGSVGEVLERVESARSGGLQSAGTGLELRRAGTVASEVEALLDSLVDPLLVAVCRRPGFRNHVVRFEDGEALASEGEGAFHTFLLLRGTVVVIKAGREITRVSGEGSFLGEVSTLAGLVRTATLRASGPVWACALNAAELERFVTANPAIGLRVIRSMATRLSRQRDARPSRPTRP